MPWRENEGKANNVKVSTPEDVRFIYVYRLAMDAKSLQGVMEWGPENIQACMRIFRQLQHQWLTRDIMHQSQGVYKVFVLQQSQDRCLTSALLPGRQYYE